MPNNIAKVIYMANSSATPEVWMDTTDKTAASGNMLSGTTALKNDGSTATGNIATKTSSDMTVSGATVTAPAGYYASDASKSVASGSASTPATSITANPSISVSSGGLITASISASQNVTPTVSAGYVSSGTAGTVSVSGSNTEQLTAQAATTYHPSTTDQTIASGKYLTGAQTIKAVEHNLTADKISEGFVAKIGDSTDDDCVASITGTHQGGTTPTGVKYIWTDVDGEGAWDVSGYAMCSVDGAPVGDGKNRIWVNASTQNGMSISIKFGETGSAVIDWGDGTSDTNTTTTRSHTYQNDGIYVIAITMPSNMFFSAGTFNQNISSHNKNVIALNILSETDYSTRSGLFSYCDSLKCVTYDMPTLTSSSFTVCAALETAVVGNSTTIIKGSVFTDCPNLKNVSMPEGLTSIGYRCFAGCTSLASITIPSTVTEMKNGNTFEGSTSLTEVHMKPTSPPTIGSGIFSSISPYPTVYVPYSSDHSILSAYQSATNWSTYASQIQEEPQ